MYIKRCIIVICLLSFFTQGKAQTVELVKDINPSGTSSVTGKIDLDGLLIFGAYETIHGSELWKSDGTGMGTVMIKDINPGAANANFMNPVYYNRKIYFSADDGSNGREIWVTDGDSTGTYMLKDINPTGSGSFSNAIVYNNLLFFNADDGVHGSEWWTTDGTLNGTQLFVDSSSIGGGPEKPFIFDGILYFGYNNGINGREPWITDGTPAGTHLLLDINQTNSLNSLPEDFTEYNGLLYFRADNGIAGGELWVTDGTPNGTHMVKDILPGVIGSFARHFISYNNLLYFEADDGTNGVELWASSGIDSGTYMVKDINGAGTSDLLGFVIYNSKLFFSAIDASHGREPWTSDGSASGTQLLLDINPTGNSMPGYFSFSMTPRQFDGKLFFVADAGTNGFELWFTDGTANGTQLIEPSGVSGISPLNIFNDFAVSGGAMYFDANYDGSGEDLYRVVTGTGIFNINSIADKMVVYPNPSSGNFQIEFTATNCIDAKIEIVNVLGENIFEKYINMKAGKNLISVSDSGIKDGTWFCRVTGENISFLNKIIMVK